MNFSRAVWDEELEPLSAFMDLIYSNSVRGIEENKLCWKPAKGRALKLEDATAL